MTDSEEPTAGEAAWFLESLGGGPKRGWQVLIQAEVFRIGRDPRLDLTLHSGMVSGHHAEIRREGGVLWLQDLGSTNGSFVNGERVQRAPLHEGDIIGFTSLEFRLGCYQASEIVRRETVPVDDLLPSQKQIEEDGRRLRRLIHRQDVDLLFQPIHQLEDQSIVGYEALGRGRDPSLPEVPVELFRVAARLGVEAELSRLFRGKLPGLLGQRLIGGTIFLNTHPAELDQEGLLRSLEELRAELPATELTLEVHERAIPDLKTIRELKARLSDLQVGIAYDDFGAGQSRLLELAELPPDYLKFDIRFIRGIDTAPASRRRLLESLVTAARDLGTRTIAEGVETVAEVEICTELGFGYAQGFYFRRPQPLEKL